MARTNVYNNFVDKETYDKVNLDNKLLLEDYLLELKQNKKSEGTISQYRNDFKIMFTYIYKKLENRSILELSKRDFRGYSLYLTEECHLSSARVNRLLSSVRSLLSFAENEDETYEYENNVAKKVKGLRNEPVREIFFLTDEQIMKLKNELINRKKYQLATLLMMAYDSAARKHELTQVNKFSFMDDSKNNTNKVIGKRRKSFCLLYFSGTKECAKLWLEQRGEDNIDSMWVVGEGENKHAADDGNIYNWFMSMRDLLAEIEGKEMDFGPHSIRHSALQNLSDNSSYICRELGMTSGFPIEKLKLIANHESVDTTQNYLKDTSIAELAQMFNIEIDTE